MMKRILDRLAASVRPRKQLNWGPFAWLIYLGFLLIPWMMHDNQPNAFWPTLVSVILFVSLYLRRYRHWNLEPTPASARQGYRDAVLTASLCYAVTPLNPWAMTYMSYAAVFAVVTSKRLLPPLLLTTALLAIYAAEVLVLQLPTILIPVTLIVGLVSCIANFAVAENRRKNAALQLSQDEIRRLATIAERERIGRDLHDLLGHTLSLIAIKSELAGKLLERNRVEAAHEIAEVSRVARDALKQVRTAVTGIRTAALEGELVSAAMLLQSSGVVVSCHREPALLPTDVETALAMIVREATTNIHRHASASQASIVVRTDSLTNGSGDHRSVLLSISDNGCGGVTARGNGLTGIDERVRSLGGTLDVQSERGRGTELRVRLPFVAVAGGATVLSEAGTDTPRAAMGGRYDSENAAAVSSGMPGRSGEPPLCGSTDQAAPT